MKEKVVLAYSGGLDTSVTIQWFIDKGYDVVAVCLDVGEGKDLDIVHQKALDMGAIESHVIDTTKEFADEFVAYAIYGNSMYEGKYPLVSALSRPLISKKLVEIAHEANADYVAHGCTGKGNDQVRFEVAIQGLDPTLKVLAPVREWTWSREEEIDYAKEKNIPIPINLDSPYSIDQNLWGRSNECGVLEDPWNKPPEDAYDLTSNIADAPDEAEELVLTFKEGLPTAINGASYDLDDLIIKLNEIAGAHGVGRIDHVENRLVGIKSREVYETPGAKVILTAKHDLETITLTKDIAHFKPVIEQKFAEQVYNGLWFSPLSDSLRKMLKDMQQPVNGEVRVELYKGNVTVTGRRSDNSLYNEKLATYTNEDAFNQDASVGFIEIFGLPTKVKSMLESGVKLYD
ncbi:argininosuccinate synthase [Salinicoccus roseus]|jgi:argininosuccinate synthase|uniref:Argininosuccinate synthase n=1 Tax=Salinicoccus roseus TaxID=45670 RepID=A0A265E9J8_9STAP|nr:argininosuccinate synthase [Salinicoccus roseus]OZT78106.1 argininosuccinate synthase [Salinicoccus roseus]RPE54176.1 argininosuccinate synthase [Salinicoccus roseus]GGA67650.1 argininosuccinate synthase [Salinicoccus roseus]